MKFINKTKHHFQLLEVMIAVFLIMICVIPTLEVFTNMYKKEAQANLINQRDHLVRLVHANLIEKMYKNEIAIEDILQPGQKDFSDANLSEKMQKIGYTCTYDIAEARPAQRFLKSDKIKNHLCNLTIHMHKKNEKTADFLYVVFIDRGERAQINGLGDPDPAQGNPQPGSTVDPELTTGNPDKTLSGKGNDVETDYSSNSSDGSDFSSRSSDGSNSSDWNSDDEDDDDDYSDYYHSSD